ncbi:hypothetical protein B0A55_08925 [Friedmanniomyces simplex]|uniref:F-box domain-containing protein n=1 Tax=Friedmanniomyces simplex TaxID=329884 RepID=A0A4U0X248_9PEZI|nr:hypothetical protein B0A55_08925 [Friedmanniomyces simplex]
MSAGPKSFFKPRLAHHKPEYVLTPTTPGSPVADWRTPRHTLVTRLRRALFPNIRQGRASPLGLSKLPYELLHPIFDHLCGREMAATRLVCREWELASRRFFNERRVYAPFFTERHPPGQHIVVALYDPNPQIQIPHDRCLFVRLKPPLPPPRPPPRWSRRLR